MNGSMPIRGRRLYLRPFEAMDFMDVYNNYASDPEVAKCVSWEPHASSEETLNYLMSFVSRYEESDYYHWAIELPTVGVVGAIDVVAKDLAAKEATIGYVLARPHWGQGFMSEALSLVLDYLEDEGFLLFKAECLVGNAASRRVLEKNGFRLVGEGERTVKGKQEKVYLFERKKGEAAVSEEGRKGEEHSFTLASNEQEAPKEEEAFESTYFFPFDGK